MRRQMQASAAALRERGRRLRAVVEAAVAFRRALRARDAGAVREARGRLVAAVDDLSMAPLGEKRRRMGPPRP